MGYMGPAEAEAAAQLTQVMQLTSRSGRSGSAASTSKVKEKQVHTYRQHNCLRLKPPLLPLRLPTTTP